MIDQERSEYEEELKNSRNDKDKMEDQKQQLQNEVKKLTEQVENYNKGTHHCCHLNYYCIAVNTNL